MVVQVGVREEREQYKGRLPRVTTGHPARIDMEIEKGPK